MELQLGNEIEFLTSRLGEVIREQAGAGVVRHIRKLTALVAESRDRNSYVDPLNYLQMDLLRKWQSARGSRQREALCAALALTVNGFAFGMKSTG